MIAPRRRTTFRHHRHLLQAVALFLALAALHGGRPLLTGNVPPAENFVNMPNCAFSWHCVRQGALPLWNPHLYCGLPHLASNHAGALYPPVYLFFALLEPFRAFGLMIALHYFWAGLGTWALLRLGWRLRQGAALAGGVFFMLSGFAVAHEAHAPMLMALSWIPWILLLSRATLAGWRWAGPLLAAAIAFQVASGYMQTAVHTLVIAGAEMIFLVFLQLKAQRSRLKAQGTPPYSPLATRYSPLGWFLAVAIGLGLMAVQFLSTVEILPMTVRTGVSFANFTSHGFAWAQLPALFFPLLFGAEQPFLLVHKLHFLPLSQSEVTMSMGAAAWLGILLLIFSASFDFRARARNRNRIDHPPTPTPQPSTTNYQLSTINSLAPNPFFWAAVCLFCLLALPGAASPLNRLLYHIPVINLFRVQNRWMVFMNLGVAILAALGYHRLLTALKRNHHQPVNLKRPLRAGLLLLALAYPAAVAWIHFSPRDAFAIKEPWDWFFHQWLTPVNPAVWLPLVFGLASLAVLALVWRRPRAVRLALALWIALFALEQGILTAQVVLRLTWPARWHTPPGNEAADWMLRRHAGRAEDFRILTPTGPNIQLGEETMPFMLPQLNGIDSVGGYWPLQNPLHARLTRIDNIGDTKDLPGLLDRPAILAMLNVRYLPVGHWFDGFMPTEWRPDLPEPPVMRLLKSGRYPWLRPAHRTTRGVTIFENTRALPRAWSVDALLPAREPAEAIDRLWAEPAFDPARQALVTWTDGRPWDAAPAGLTTATVRLARRTPDRVWLEVDAPRGPAFVVLGEAWYPGWWARVDGKLAPIHIVNGILRGIEVPAGHHEVYLRYLPPGFRRGLLISLAFAAVWALWLLYNAFQHRRRPIIPHSK